MTFHEAKPQDCTRDLGYRSLDLGLDSYRHDSFAKPDGERIRQLREVCHDRHIHHHFFYHNPSLWHEHNHFLHNCNDATADMHIQPLGVVLPPSPEMKRGRESPISEAEPRGGVTTLKYQWESKGLNATHQLRKLEYWKFFARQHGGCILSFSLEPRSEVLHMRGNAEGFNFGEPIE